MNGGQVNLLFKKRLAKIYVDILLDNGPEEADDWADRTLPTRKLKQQIEPFVIEEYKKRGLQV